MKPWIIYYTDSIHPKATSTKFNTRPEAVKFINKTIASGGFVKNIKWDGKNISAKDTFEILIESGLRIIPR